MKLLAVMKFLAVILLLTCCSCKEQLHTTLHVLTILSVEEGDNSTTAWTQGADIFQGACAAAVDVNNSPDHLSQYELVPVPVLVPDCDPVRGLQSLLEALLDPTVNIVGVTGMFCDRVDEFYSPFLTRWIRNINISGTHTQLLPSLLPSPEHKAEAIVSLMYRLGWRRFGVAYFKPEAYQYPYYNYINLAKSIHQVIKIKHRNNISVSFYELSRAGKTEVRLFLRSLKSSGVHIFVVLLPRPIASVLMQEASKEGLAWPEYVWVFVQLDPAVLFPSPEWENVIIMSYSIMDRSDSSSSGRVRHWDPYSCLLYESVWALAVYLNNFFSKSNISISPYSDQNRNSVRQDRTGIFNVTCEQSQLRANKNNPSRFDVVFIQGNGTVVIGVYDFRNFSILLNESILQSLPPDTFQFVFLRTPPEISIPLSIWILLLYTLVTVNLVLFLSLRKEREIKASSVPLSMCIFAGNYLLLLCTTNSVIVTGFIANRERIRQTTCNVEIVSGSVGLDIVITTALVRTLRIYHIFHYFGKIKRGWSDSRLVLVIAAIISIKLYLLVIWISVDNNHLMDRPEFQQEAEPPYYLVHQPCSSDYLVFWALSVYLYTGILLAILFCLAIKTRKIHLHDFKDTKKLTFLVFCLLIVLLVFGNLWGIFRQAGYPIASIVCLDLYYSLGVLIIQTSLFLPKVIPPLNRKIKQQLEKRDLRQ